MASEGSTAGGTAPTERPSEQDTIDLRILSPSSGIPQEGLAFTGVPITTTAGELKRMIQNAVEQRPEPAAQRLIYRGRVVARDTDRLGDVFGREQLLLSRTQNLHLVLSDPSSTAGPRSSTAPPNQNPFRSSGPNPSAHPQTSTPPLPTNPFRAQNAATQPNIPRPQSQPPPQGLNQHNQQIRLQAPIRLPPGVLGGNPDMVSQALMQQMAMAQQNLMGQLPPVIRDLPQIQQQIQQMFAQQVPNLHAQVMEQHNRASGQNTPAPEGGARLGQDSVASNDANTTRQQPQDSEGESTTDTDGTSESGTDGSESEREASQRTPAARPRSDPLQRLSAPSTVRSGSRSGTRIPNVFQQVAAEQEQQRGAGGAQSNGTPSSEPQQPQPEERTSTPHGATTPNVQRTLNNHHHIYTAEGLLPNGQRYSMTINSNMQMHPSGTATGSNTAQPAGPGVQNDLQNQQAHTHAGLPHFHFHQGTPPIQLPGGPPLLNWQNTQMRNTGNPQFPVHTAPNGPSIFAPIPIPFNHFPGQPLLQAPFRLSATGTPRTATPVGGLRSLSVPAPSRQPSPPTYQRLWGGSGLYNQLAHTHQALQTVQRQLHHTPPVRVGEALSTEALQQLTQHRNEVDQMILEIELTVMRPNLSENQLAVLQESANVTLGRARGYFGRSGGDNRENTENRGPSPSNATSAVPSTQPSTTRPSAAAMMGSLPGQSGMMLPQGHRVQSLSPQTQLLVLSGPNGPYALLVGPSGRYTTPLPSSLFASAAASPQHEIPALQPTPTIPAGAAAAAAGRGAQQQDQAGNQAQPHNAENAAPQPAAANNNNNNAAAAHEQMFGLDLDVWLNHLWTFVKLFLLVYFFSGGSGWRRPVLLTAAATIVFLAQIGAFRGRWFDGVRRHVEDLLPVEARQVLLGQQPGGGDQNRERERDGERPRPAGGATPGAPPQPGGQQQQQQLDTDSQQRANQAPAHQQQQQQQQQQQLNPEEVAARLLREQQDRDAHWLRQHLRSAERGAALFFASLWPGVGERAVAARREEEERRRVAGERLETETAQQQQQQQQQEERRDAGVEGAVGEAVGGEEQRQRPVVEA